MFHLLSPLFGSRGLLPLLDSTGRKLPSKRYECKKKKKFKPKTQCLLKTNESLMSLDCYNETQFMPHRKITQNADIFNCTNSGEWHTVDTQDSDPNTSRSNRSLEGKYRSVDSVHVLHMNARKKKNRHFPIRKVNAENTHYFSANINEFDVAPENASNRCYCRFCLQLSTRRPVHCRYYNPRTSVTADAYPVNNYQNYMNGHDQQKCSCATPINNIRPQNINGNSNGQMEQIHNDNYQNYQTNNQPQNMQLYTSYGGNACRCNDNGNFQSHECNRYNNHANNFSMNLPMTDEHCNCNCSCNRQSNEITNNYHQTGQTGGNLSNINNQTDEFGNMTVKQGCCHCEKNHNNAGLNENLNGPNINNCKFCSTKQQNGIENYYESEAYSNNNNNQTYNSGNNCNCCSTQQQNGRNKYQENRKNDKSFQCSLPKQQKEIYKNGQDAQESNNSCKLCALHKKEKAIKKNEANKKRLKCDKCGLHKQENINITNEQIGLTEEGDNSKVCSKRQNRKENHVKSSKKVEFESGTGPENTREVPPPDMDKLDQEQFAAESLRNKDISHKPPEQNKDSDVSMSNMLNTLRQKCRGTKTLKLKVVKIPKTEQHLPSGKPKLKLTVH